MAFVHGITRAQIQDIVAGRVTTWAQIPGSPRTDAIVPVVLDPTTGAGQVFPSVFVDVDTPTVYRPITLATDTQMRAYVEQTPGALGYVDLALTGTLQRHDLRRGRVHASDDQVGAPTPPSARSASSPAADHAARSAVSYAGRRSAARRAR